MPENLGEWKPVGKVTHYFDKIKVAVIELFEGLKKGDKVRFVGGEDTDFEQEINSMEVDHESIDKAKKGDEVGMQVDQKVREGYKIYKE